MRGELGLELAGGVSGVEQSTVEGEGHRVRDDDTGEADICSTGVSTIVRYNVWVLGG